MEKKKRMKKWRRKKEENEVKNCRTETRANKMLLERAIKFLECVELVYGNFGRVAGKLELC